MLRFAGFQVPGLMEPSAIDLREAVTGQFPATEAAVGDPRMNL